MNLGRVETTVSSITPWERALLHRVGVFIDICREYIEDRIRSYFLERQVKLFLAPVYQERCWRDLHPEGSESVNTILEIVSVHPGCHFKCI